MRRKIRPCARVSHRVRVLESRVEFNYLCRVRANSQVSRGVVRVLESYTMPRQSLNSTILEYRVEFE